MTCFCILTVSMYYTVSTEVHYHALLQDIPYSLTFTESHVVLIGENMLPLLS